MNESADISNNSTPDAVCFSWCHIQLIAHLCHRNSEVLSYTLVYGYVFISQANQNMTVTCKAIPFTAEESNLAFYYTHSKSVQHTKQLCNPTENQLHLDSFYKYKKLLFPKAFFLFFFELNRHSLKD